MNNIEKIAVMEKLVRELEDLANSQTSVLKKISQIEAENINLGDKYLEDTIPDIFEHADNALTKANEVHQEYVQMTEKFRQENQPVESDISGS